MKVFLNENVYEAALRRMRWIFDEFPNVVVGISGGKDSTIVYNIAYQIAKEKDRLPLKVMFVDQEAEWEHVIEYLRDIMYNPDVEPYWLQVPMRLFNATSYDQVWLNCWDPKEEGNWIREKEPISIKENIYKTDRFGKMFPNFMRYQFPGQKSCYVAGVRTDESPRRAMAMMNGLAYKEATWGRVLNKKHQQYTLYPIYDWNYRDVWKAIHENKWPYCKIYDFMYQHGVSTRFMRISNVHHETATHQLRFLQEMEPETWDKILNRVKGVNSVKQLGKDVTYVPNKLPYMFESWTEYRDHLLKHMIKDENIYKKFKEEFDRIDEFYIHPLIRKYFAQVCIGSIITNDYYKTKLKNAKAKIEVANYRNWRLGKPLYHGYRIYIIDALKNPVKNESRKNTRAS